ncbi:hypothetical protein C8Q79DRAFT_313539 [Trametes meyenii]|nr:hypothetical protein C8Q79DRAFT_313539 [Trametes meyenii]
MASQDAQTQLNGGMAPLGVYISANEFAEPLYILSHSMLLEVITRGAPPPLSLNTPTFPAAVRGHFAYTQSWLEENPTSSNSQFPANVYTTTASHVATQQNINFNSVEDGWQQTSAHDLSTPHTTPFSVQDGWSVPQIPPDVASPMPTGLSAPHQMQIPSQAPSFTLTTAAPTTSPGGAPLAHISTPHVPGPPGAPDAGILGASQSGNSTRNSSAARAQRQSTVRCVAHRDLPLLFPVPVNV